MKGTSATFSATASDDVALYGIQLYIDDLRKATSCSSTISYTTGSLSIGSHTILVVANDMAGNFSRSSITVNVTDNVKDTTCPLINPITSSAGSTFTKGTSTTFSTTASDNVALEKIQLYIDGSRATISYTSTITYTTSSLTVGSHMVKVIAYDTSGNYNETSTTIKVTDVVDTEKRINEVKYTSANFKPTAYKMGDRDGLSYALYAPTSATKISTHVDMTKVCTNTHFHSAYKNAEPWKSDQDNAYIYLCCDCIVDVGLLKAGDDAWKFTINGISIDLGMSDPGKSSDLELILYSDRTGYLYFECIDHNTGTKATKALSVRQSSKRLGVIVSVTNSLANNDSYRGEEISWKNKKERLSDKIKRTFYTTLISSSQRDRSSLEIRNVKFFNTYYYSTTKPYGVQLTKANGYLWIYPNRTFNNKDSSKGEIYHKGSSTPIVTGTEYKNGKGQNVLIVDIVNY